MGIKNAMVRMADKAGNAVAKVSALSSAQLDEIERKREAYLSEKPDPSDPQAIELTNRLLATAGVEIHGAYLPQLRDVYCPVEASVEFPDSFDALHNIRHMNITKWIVDPKEDSLEKLINVYDVLADEDCNIALVFNRTSSTTNVYLAVVDTNNTEDNIDVETSPNVSPTRSKATSPDPRSAIPSAVQSPAFRNVIHSQSPPCRMSRPRKTTGS